MALTAVRLMQNFGRPALCFHVPTTSTTTATTSGISLAQRYYGQPMSLLSQIRLLQTPSFVLNSSSNKSVMITRRSTINGGDSIKHFSLKSSLSKGEDNKVNSTSSSPASQNSSKPTEEQLSLICERLTKNLPKFFKVPHDFRIYNRGIIFEDNIRDIRTEGLNQYAWQIAKIKMGAHFKYGKVNLDLLKLTSHPEDGTIRLRWRIVTYPGNSIVLAFWKVKLWNIKESVNEEKDNWIDGFSILHVGGDGLIYKHVADKVIPDTDQVKPKKGSPNMAIKVAIVLGLLPAGEESLADSLGSWILANIWTNL